MIIVGCVVTSSKLLLDSFLAEPPVTPVIMSGGRGCTTSDQGFIKYIFEGYFYELPHGRLYTWTENSFPFFFISETSRDIKKMF